MASDAGSTVLEVGPDTVRVLAGRAGRPGSPALIAAALDWIDDPVGLLDESPVAVADLWHAVMESVLGRDCRSVVVVHPPDWPWPRVGRVLAAANSFADRVVAVSRTEWTPTDTPTDTPADPSTDPPEDRPGPLPGRRRRLRPSAVVIAAALALSTAIVLVAGFSPPRSGPEPVTLVEGRVEVRVPSHWTVQRVTGGPGSRRVQVNSPSEPDIALHITQTYAPESTLADAAGILGRAVAGQSAGVFVDFRPEDVVAGRPAVTYREVRPGRVIRWTVLPVGAVRIGIGCQSPPAREGAVRAVCDEAVRSARERGTASGR